MTGHVSPQFHVVYDDQFSTVSSVPIGDELTDDLFLSTDWAKLVEAGCERVLDEDFDERGHLIPTPELSDEWLTPAERRLRTLSQQRRQHHQMPRLVRGDQYGQTKLVGETQISTVHFHGPGRRNQSNSKGMEN